MLKLIVKDHGEETILIEGYLEDIVEYLKENENVYNWIQDEEPEKELPNLDKIENLRELKDELDKIDLDWWTLEVEEV